MIRDAMAARRQYAFQRVWRAIDAGVSAAAQSLPAQVKQTRVYFEVNRGPYGAGDSWYVSGAGNV